jgi:hypothetical protein
MKDEVQSLAELFPIVNAVPIGSKQRFHFRFGFNHFCCRENGGLYNFYMVNCWLTSHTTEDKRKEQTIVFGKCYYKLHTKHEETGQSRSSHKYLVGLFRNL